MPWNMYIILILKVLPSCLAKTGRGGVVIILPESREFYFIHVFLFCISEILHFSASSTYKKHQLESPFPLHFPLTLVIRLSGM